MLMGWTDAWETKPHMCKNIFNTSLTFMLQTVTTWHLDLLTTYETVTLSLSLFLSLSLCESLSLSLSLSFLWGQWTTVLVFSSRSYMSLWLHHFLLAGPFSAAALTRESLWNSNQDISSTGARAEWTQSRRSGPRDGPWNELELENHRGDTPRSAANFTIIINLSL